MKELLRNLFSPILKPLEQGDEPFSHKPLNRKILITVGVLFMVLCGVAAFFALSQQAPVGYLLPVLVFFAAGAVCLIVGLLGNDRAVSKIWGNR